MIAWVILHSTIWIKRCIPINPICNNNAFRNKIANHKLLWSVRTWKILLLFNSTRVAAPFVGYITEAICAHNIRYLIYLTLSESSHLSKPSKLKNKPMQYTYCYLFLIEILVFFCCLFFGGFLLCLSQPENWVCLVIGFHFRNGINERYGICSSFFTIL